MTITREQIEMYASAADATQTFEMDKGKLIAVEPEHMQELARMALAGMKAEPVAVVDIQRGRGDGKKYALCFTSAGHSLPDDVYNLYTAPQPLTTSERAELENYRNAQQVVPEVRPDWQRNEFSAGWNACRAAMLQGGKS